MDQQLVYTDVSRVMPFRYTLRVRTVDGGWISVREFALESDAERMAERLDEAIIEHVVAEQQ